MSENVDITLSANPVQLAPGESQELVVTVTNNSREVDRFELEVTDINPAWYRFDWSEILLYPDQPGNQGTVFLQITIPPDAMPTTYSPVLQATSGNQAGQVTTFPFLLIVSAPETQGVEVSLAPAKQESSDKVVSYQVNLRNASSRPTTVHLRAEQPPEYATALFNFRANRIELDPNGISNTMVEVRPRKRNYVGANRQHYFRVIGDTVVAPAPGELIQICSLPWLRRILITPLVFIPLLIVPLLISGLFLWWLWPTSSVAKNDTPVGICYDYSPKVNVDLLMRNGSTYILKSTPGQTSPPEVLFSEDTANLPGIFDKLVSVSPDGEKVVYVTARNTGMQGAEIKLVQVNSKAPSRLVTVNDVLWPTRPIWSPDSTRVGYIVLRDQRLQLWTINIATDRRPQQVAAQAQAELSQYLQPDLFYGSNVKGPVCWSNDNSRVLIDTINPNQQVEVTLASGQVSKPRTKLRPNQLTPVATSLPAQPNPNNVGGQKVALRTFQQVPNTGATPAATPGLTVTAGTECDIPTRSQNDPRWRNEIVRSKVTTGVNVTLAEVGCPILAATMVFNYNTYLDTPTQLTQCLAEDAIPFSWVTPASKCSRGIVNPPVEQNFDWQVLNNTLQRGQPAIVGLLSPQSGNQYVVVTGGFGSNGANYRVNDPWDGSSYKTLADFFDVGYVPNLLVIYSGSLAPSCGDRTQSPNNNVALTPDFTVSSPQDGAIYNQAVTFQVQAQPGLAAPKATVRRVAGGSLNFVSVNATPSAASTPTPIPTTEASAVPISNGSQILEQGLYEIAVDPPTVDSLTPRTYIRFVIDRTPPVVEHVANLTAPLGAVTTPVPGANPISAGPVTIELRAADNLSGLSAVQYQLTNVTTDWKNYSDPVFAKPLLVETAGDYTLLYRAIDGAGNASQVQTYRFTITTGAGVNTQATATVQAGQIATIAAQNEANNNATLTAIAVQQNQNNANTGGGGAVVVQPTANPNAGGNAGGGGAVVVQPTPRPTTVPIPPTPTLAPAILQVNPPTILLDTTQSQAQIQLLNTGGSPTNWSLVPLTEPGSTYVKVALESGLVPAGGNVNVPITLLNPNYTSSAISVTVGFKYRDDLPPVAVNVIVSPVPLPAVKFLSPVASSTLVTSNIEIKLDVPATGVPSTAKATFSVKYIDVGATVATEKPLPTEANAAGGWKINWDISGLNPQQGIEIRAKFCFTSDYCKDVETAVTGLILPTPTATITVAPELLGGDVTITAVVAPGALPVAQIVYTATYKLNPSDTAAVATGVALPDKATPDKAYIIKWSTGTIPPQQGIKLDARICWRADDNACAPLTTQSKTLNIDLPILAIDPLAAPAADPQDLPATFSISGTVQKLSSASYSVIVSFDYIATAGATTKQSKQVTTKPTVTSGAGSWKVDITDLATAPAQTIVFTAKVCIDGTSPLVCYPSPAPTVSGIIKDISVEFVSPAADSVISGTTQIVVKPSSATRVSSVKFSVGVSGKPDSAVSTAPVSAGGNVTTTIDTVALGIMPDTAFTVKAQPCNSGGCGTVKPLSLKTAPTTLENIQVVASSGTIVPTLTPNVSVQATVKGRLPTSLSYWIVYKNPITATTTLSSSIGSATALVLDQPSTAALALANVIPAFPPQGGLSLIARLCWSGTFAPTAPGNCVDIATPFTNFAVADPVVTNIFVNGITPFTAAALPIPYDNTTITSTSLITLPITAAISGTNLVGVKWRLDIQPPGTFTPTLSTLNNISTTLGVNFNVPLNLLDLKTKAGDLSLATVKLVIIPVWGGTGSPQQDFDKPTSIKEVVLQFVPNTVQISRGSLPIVTFPATAPDNLMFTKVTTFTGTLTDATGTVQRIIFEMSGKGALNANVTITKTAVVLGGAWSFAIDHTVDNKFIPQSGIKLAWRLCATVAPDDSGCLPPTTINQPGMPRISNLGLAGVNLTVQNSEKPNGFLNSNFTPQVTPSNTEFISTSAQISNSLRFFAYHTPATPSENFTNTRVLLSSYAPNIKPFNVTANQWSVPLYFPNSDMTPPPTGTFSATTLISAAVDNKVTISVQYCIGTPNPIFTVDDPLCSDWSGVTLGQLDPSGLFVAKQSTKQAMIVNWLSYDFTSTAPFTETTPFNLFVQRDVAENVVTRTVRTKILPFSNITVITLTYNYETPSVGLVDGAVNLSAGNLYTATWDVRQTKIGTLLDDGVSSPPPTPAPPTTRSVKLNATIQFNDASSGNNYTFINSIFTGGKPTGVTPAAVIAPIIASFTPTIAATATSTPVPTDTATPNPTNTTVASTATATTAPTVAPTITPTYTPTVAPTATLTPPIAPTNTPTYTPTIVPTATSTSTIAPTNTPTITPTP